MTVIDNENTLSLNNQKKRYSDGRISWKPDKKANSLIELVSRFSAIWNVRLRFKRYKSYDNWIPVPFQVQEIMLKIRIGIWILKGEK